MRTRGFEGTFVRAEVFGEHVPYGCDHAFGVASTQIFLPLHQREMQAPLLEGHVQLLTFLAQRLDPGRRLHSLSSAPHGVVNSML